MPDDPKTQDPNPEPPKDGDGNDDQEGRFWTRLSSTLDERIDAALDRRDKKRAKDAPTGTSRSGRTNLPAILADFVFGPPKGD